MSSFDWNRLSALAPIVQWVWGGVFAVVVATGIVLYDMKMESTELQHKIELKEKVDEVQDKKIDALTDAIKKMSEEQKKATDAITELKITLINQQHNLVRMVEESKKANELLSARLDSHIALQNQKDK